VNTKIITALLAALSITSINLYSSAVIKLDAESEKKSAHTNALQAKNKNNARRQQDMISNILSFPPELNHIIQEYHFSPMDFFTCIYQPLPSIQGHANWILSLAISADGQTIVSGSADHTIKIWDIATRQDIKTLRDTDAIPTVAISPDNKFIVAGSGAPGNNSVKIWDIGTQQYATLSGHTALISSIALSTDSKIIVSSSYDKTIKIWDAPTQQCLGTLCEADLIFAIAISSDNKFIASASKDMTIKIWDIASQQCVAILRGHTNIIYAIALSRDNTTIISASADKTIKIWGMLSKECKATLSGHTDAVRTIKLSNDNKTLISSSWDQTVKIWDMNTKTCVATVRDHSDTIPAIAISSDARTIASGSSDKTIKMYQQNQKLLSTITQLPYEQLHCLKLILNGLNGQEITLNPEHAAYYTRLIQKTWDDLPREIKVNLQHYFKELNIKQSIIKALFKRDKK